MFYWGNFGAAQNSVTHGYLSNGTYESPSGDVPTWPANVQAQGPSGLPSGRGAHTRVQKFPFSGPTASSAVQQTSVWLLNNNGWSSGPHGFISGATNPLLQGPPDIDNNGSPTATGIFTSVYVFPFASDTTKKAYDNALFAAQRSAEGWV